MDQNILRPHGNRRRVFPNAHIPNTDHINQQILVTKLSKEKENLMAIFQEDPTDFRAINIELGSGLQSLFKNNVLFLCDLYGIGLNDLFRHTQEKGIKG